VPSPLPLLGVCAGALAGLASLTPPARQLPPLRAPAARAAVAALAPGKLLVAARRLPDPNFANAVVLLADVNKDGAVGLVLNRRSSVTLARVFPQLVPTMATASHAFLGGPVDTTRTMALIRAAQAPTGARHIVDGVHLATAREAVEAAIAAGTAAARLRVYLGYAGWGAGQLEAETEQGVWHVLEADAEIVFDAEPSSTWQRQIARTELIQATGGPQPGRTTRPAIACGGRSPSSGDSRGTSSRQSCAAASSWDIRRNRGTGA
jgi:putative transcriptional regulator